MGQANNKKKSSSIEVLRVFFQVIADDMKLFVLLHDKEPDATLLKALLENDFPNGLGLNLVTEYSAQGRNIIEKALSALSENIDQSVIDELAVDYANIYLNYRIHASPEESVWIDEEDLTCQDSMFQVRSWYEKYGMQAENWRIRPDDHLVLQLQFLNYLFSIAKSQTDLQEIAQFMDEHLLRWLSSFSERVANRCDTPYFAGIALLTNAYCEELRDLIATIVDQSRPTQEEIEKRMKPSANIEEVQVSFMPGLGPAV
ncbi:MAG: molecular chaperone TorD family protein [Candidatus Thiodiazotropha sp. DIVDIV]